MMRLSRSDSRATIWVKRSRSPPPVTGPASASMAPVMDASGFLISWAMLAAIRPSVARRSAWRIRVSISRISERSSQMAIIPRR